MRKFSGRIYGFSLGQNVKINVFEALETAVRSFLQIRFSEYFIAIPRKNLVEKKNARHFRDICAKSYL